jgi:ubiquinone/menaquinone biosynthesis C-methylase UbiE
MVDDSWRVWDRADDYREDLYDRAVGHAPEMESSKALAVQLEPILTPEKTVLDVGCAVGHYLRSLRNHFDFPFRYTGLDATEHFIDRAREAFAQDAYARFMVGDIFNLPVDDNAYDVVTCSNVFLHLPSIAVPLQELWRVTRQFLVIRTLVGDVSFRIKQVREWEGQADDGSLDEAGDPWFDPDGEPKNYHFYNIYSQAYIRHLCSALDGMTRVEITPDIDFDPDAFASEKRPSHNTAADITTVLGGWQINNYVLQPWAFIKLWRT